MKLDKGGVHGTLTLPITFLMVLTFLLGTSVDSKKEKAERFIMDQLARRHVPGASVAVIRSNQYEIMAGYGIAEILHRKKVTQDTVFQIASATKSFTAVCILYLIEQRKLKLEDRASTYLSWMPEIYSEVTLRQILTHTSGVNRDLRKDNLDEIDEKEFRKRLAEAPRSFPPGERWEYSNTGYILLGSIIQSVTGKSYDHFLEEQFFKKLGMARTVTSHRLKEFSDVAKGYEWNGTELQPSPYYSGGASAGGMASSVKDLANWNVALQSNQILSKQYRELMFTASAGVSFPFRNQTSSYGMGWFLTRMHGKPLITHGGAISGFSSIVNRFPEENLLIIVLCNAKAGEDKLGHAEAIASGLADIYLNAD
ncbi:beta-lactamase family protein [bacterium]|nr:beta-lactamase family protein [bacterium]